MAAQVLEAERTLPYAARDLCALVGDVRSYPRFIPWLKDLRVTSERAKGEGWEGVAEATVGWKAITERFTTRVACAPEDGKVSVSLVKGPFKSLSNEWRFEDAPGGARVHFWISFEFKNPVLQKVLTLNRKQAEARVLRAFESEARRRLPLKR